MKKTTGLALAGIALLSMSSAALAAEKPAAKSGSFEDQLETNLSVTTNYVWRGQTQGGSAAALQGGATYTNPNGLSLDLWMSSSAPTSNETDLTVSYAGKSGNLGFEFGAIKYYYSQDDSANFAELFGGININNLNVYAYKDLNGSDSGNNLYIELSTEIKNLSLALGVNSNDNDFADYNQFTAAYTLKQLTFSVSVTDEDNADEQLALTYAIPLK